MPVAKPLAEALREKPLSAIVEVFGTIATTLGQLHAEGISHRDIKPPNLYWYEGGPAIGDFGLVRLPEPSDLTDPDRPIGARNFIPYELIADPANAAGPPVDVFMLIKTFWVLATNQRWPPQGEQRADNASISISGFRADSRARVLDGLIERGTRHVPNDRPAMLQVADDLAAWLALPDVGPEADLRDGLSRLRAAAASGLSEAAKRATQEAAFREQVNRLSASMGHIEDKVAAEYPVAVFDGYDDLAEGTLKHHEFLGSPSVIDEDIRATRLDEPRDFPRSLIVGRSLALTDDGLLHADGITFMGSTAETGGEDLWRFQPRPAPVDTIQATAEVDRLISEIVEGFPAWITAFAESLEI
jgi:serine/threonine protein kinase